MRPTLSVFVVAGCLAVSDAAQADDGMYPNIGVEYDATFQYDRTKAKGGSRSTTGDGYLDLVSTVYFRFSPDSEIWLGTELNPVVDLEPGEDRWFGGMGLTVTDLNFFHQGVSTGYRVGKFQVPFGRAQDNAPGFYTQDFIGAYDRGGMLGATGEYRFFGERMGTLAPSLSVYTQDNTFLSRPYLRPGTKASRADGGAANTGRLDSYAAVVNWTSFAGMPFVEAQLGYMRNAKGTPVPPPDADPGQPPPPAAPAAAESVRGASLRAIIPSTRSTELGPTLDGSYLDFVPFVEYVEIDNEGGNLGADTTYLTTALTVNYGRWIYGVTRTRRDIDGEPDEHVSELSVAYQLTGLIQVAGSLGRQEIGGERADLVGVSFTYSGGY